MVMVDMCSLIGEAREYYQVIVNTTQKGEKDYGKED